jgi:mRNA interferase MazF
MRPIHVVTLDKARPAVILTRGAVRRSRTRVTIAPFTSTARGLSAEVRVDEANGLDHESVISLDNIATVSVDHVGRLVGSTSLRNRTVNWPKRSSQHSIWTSSTFAATLSRPVFQ